MGMPGILRRDSLGSLYIIINLLPVEQGEDPLASRMHEVLIDVIHTVIDDHIPDSSVLVCVKLLLLVQEALVDLVMEAVLLVFVLEETAEDYRAGLGAVDDLEDYGQDGKSAEGEQPSLEDQL